MFNENQTLYSFIVKRMKTTFSAPETLYFKNSIYFLNTSTGQTIISYYLCLDCQDVGILPASAFTSPNTYS